MGIVRASVIDLRRLAVYRPAPLLAGVDWTVRRGEHWVILGANGSGKSTLVNALAGYVTPSDGEMTVLGETYGRSDWRLLREKIGLVSGNLIPRFNEDETALEVVACGLRGHINLWTPPTPGESRAARRWLARVEAAALADRPWGVLSQGERQRVLIARALTRRPALLVLDEPCAGLDPLARETFVAFLSRLGRRPAPALVLVTHHVEEIAPVFTHALALRRGAVAATGPLNRVLTGPVLSRVFDAPARVTRVGRAFRLSLRPRPAAVL